MGFGGALASLWKGASDSAKAAARAISSGTAAVVHKGQDAAKAVAGAAQHGAQAAASKATDAWNATKGAANRAWDTAADAAGHAWDATKDAASTAWTATKGAAVRAWDATTDAVANAWDAARDAAVAARNQAMQAATAASAAVSERAEAAYRKAKEVFGPHLVGQPIEPCPASLAGKRLRQEERRLLIGDARREAAALPEASRRGLLATAARFERDIGAVERARLADDVYDTTRDPPTGWKRLSTDPAALAELGLKPEDFAPTDSGFRAALYRSELTGEQVLAFKGTTPSSLGDWGANLKQGLGMESDYYNRAKGLARLLKNAAPGKVTLAGHSLGGGLASAASAVTGLPADTFNAAGLHPDTIAKYNVTREMAAARIDAYRVEGEILTTVQDTRVQDAAVLSIGAATASPELNAAYAGFRATGHRVAYDAIGTPHTLPAVDEQGRSWFIDEVRMLDKHGMPRVVNGLEKQKSDDQHALQTALGRH